MKTSRALEQLKVLPIEEFPTVKKVLGRVKEEDGTFTYQGQEIQHYKEGLAYLKSHYIEWIDNVEVCLQNRLKSGESEVLLP